MSVVVYIDVGASKIERQPRSDANLRHWLNGYGHSGQAVGTVRLLWRIPLVARRRALLARPLYMSCGDLDFRFEKDKSKSQVRRFFLQIVV